MPFKVYLPGIVHLSELLKGRYLSICLSSFGPLLNYAAPAAKSLQSCPTLCDPTDGSPPGSVIPGILQARTPEWVAISFSNAWKWKVKVKSLSLSDSLWPHGLQPTRLLRPWDSPGKSAGVGCHCRLLLNYSDSIQTLKEKLKLLTKVVCMAFCVYDST